MNSFTIPFVAFVAAIVAFLAVVYKIVIYPAFVSPLSKIPAANKICRFSPLWMHYIRYMDRENDTMYKLHKKHGPIVLLGPNELSINCFEGGVKTIYGGGFPKHEFYSNRFSNYNIANMFTMKDNKSHSVRKRMFSHFYSKSNILCSPNVQAATKAMLYERLLPLIDSSACAKAPVDMYRLNFAYATDTFMAVQFGRKLGSNHIQNESERNWFIDCFIASRPWIYWTDNVPKLTRRLSKLGIRIIPRWAEQSILDLFKWQIGICDRAEALLSDGADLSVEETPSIFAQHRMAMEKTAGPSVDLSPQPYPHRMEIASEMFDHIAASHETVGVTLTYLFYELSLRPALQAELRKELLTLSPPLLFDPLDTSPPQEMPDPKSVDALPLLDAVLQETLRRWPDTPGGQPRVTPYPSCSLAGYENIPPNMRVQASAYVLHRNEDVFPSPEEWRPERWLNASPKELAEMKHWFWAWGSGSRMCLGQHFATNAMKYVTAALYTNYTSEVVGTPDMVPIEGFIGRPRGEELVLRWTRV